MRGGWPALYAANRRVIGADPDVIRAGTVLAIPGPRGPAPGRACPGPPRVPAAAAAAAPAGGGHRPGPVRVPAAGMPSWLRAVLLAAGLLIGAAFAAEPVLAVRRRRAAARAARATAAARPLAGARAAGRAGPGWQARPSGRRGRGRLPGARPGSWWLIMTGWW